MRRFFKILAWVAAVVIAVPVLLVAGIMVGANTGPGRRLIETMTPRLTGGMVRIAGLAGRFPDAVRLHQISVADANGVWVTVDDAALDWSPRTLLSGEVTIDRLEAERVAVARLPTATSGGSESGGTSFPIPHVELSRLRVARLNVDAAVTGRAIDLTVEGSGDLAGPETGAAHLVITTIASAAPDRQAQDHYMVEASMDASHLHATLDVSEAPKGLISGFAQLPDLGAVTIKAAADGPLNALATKVTIAAGPLRGSLDGTVNMDGQAADLAFAATSPEMNPAPGVGWSSIQLQGNMHGPFVSPEATGTLSADGLTAAGAAIGSVRANLAGDASGKAELHAQLDGLRVPGPAPDVLANGPLTIDATGQLLGANPSAQFTVRHALFSAQGTAGLEHATVRLDVPDLKPFAAIGGVDLQGRTTLDIDVAQTNGAIDLAVKGGIGISGGINPVPALVGDAGTIDLAANLRGEDLRLSRFSFDGSAIHTTVTGQFVDRRLDADWTLSLSDLGAIRPGASGTVSGRGHVSGPPTSLSATADISGDVAAEGGRLEQFTAHLNADGLPDAPTGRLTAGGSVLGAPLAVAVDVERRSSGFHVVIDHTAWKSLTADGTLDLADGQTLPTGKISLAMTRLADLSTVIGEPIAGSINASLDSSADGARMSAVVAGVTAPNVAMVSKANLEATVTSPTNNPLVDATLTLDGVEASGVRASGRLAAKGPLDRVALTVGAQTGEVHGAPARVETAGTLNATDRVLLLASFQANWGKEAIRLLAPTRIGFAQGVTIDKLRLGFRQAELAIAGTFGAGPAAPGRGGTPIDLTVNLTNFPADVGAIVDPTYAADGTIAGEARLTGSTASPQGTVHITASAVRLRRGSGRALPPANLVFGATLDGTSAKLDSKLTAGKSDIALTGLAPTNLAGRMDLRVAGTADLTLLNPLLTAQGRQVKGTVEVALGVSGTPSAPIANGTVRLANGDVQDAAFGMHLSAISAALQADGDTIRLDRFDAAAGAGTLSGGGTVRLAQGFTGPPIVDLTLKASNAKVLASDLITTVIDANLTVRGDANGTITLGGTLKSREADIQVPEKLPASIAVIPVRNAGTPPPKPPPPSSSPDIVLNFTFDAPAQVYIRGRGLDVELGGKIVFSGTAAHPVTQGGLQLRRGTVSLAGQSLTLTEGTIDFSGGGITNPSLKLVATSTSATVTATMTISGDVKHLKITLSSVPDLPQDEILSQLLFNTARSRLSPFQLAEIAAALAQISGVGGGATDPLGGLRSALGLDQLSVGSGAGGAATLQAGRYVARGVRVGASQSATGGQTAASVQIDLAKGLKLETTVATSSSATAATPGTSNGTSVGLTYQFEY